jgi:hypothetical protein
MHALRAGIFRKHENLAVDSGKQRVVQRVQFHPGSGLYFERVFRHAGHCASGVWPGNPPEVDQHGRLAAFSSVTNWIPVILSILPAKKCHLPTVAWPSAPVKAAVPFNGAHGLLGVRFV